VTPACPLATVLYRFDDAARFPVMESHTTAQGPVAVRTDRDDAGRFLRIAYQRQAADADEVTIVLALPLVAIDGRPRQLLLDVLGGSGVWGLQLEGMDGGGGPILFSFGVAEFEGWGTLRTEARQVATPVQFHRLRLISAGSSASPDLGLRLLSVTGAVRLVPPGIARSALDSPRLAPRDGLQSNHPPQAGAKCQG